MVGDITPYINKIIKYHGKRKDIFQTNYNIINNIINSSRDELVIFNNHINYPYFGQIKKKGNIKLITKFKWEWGTKKRRKLKTLYFPTEGYVKDRKEKEIYLSWSNRQGYKPSHYRIGGTNEYKERELKNDIIIGKRNIENYLGSGERDLKLDLYKDYFSALKKFKEEPSNHMKKLLSELVLAKYLYKGIKEIGFWGQFYTIIEKEFSPKEIIREIVPGRKVDLIKIHKEAEERKSASSSFEGNGIIGPGYWKGGRYFDMDGMPAMD